MKNVEIIKILAPLICTFNDKHLPVFNQYYQSAFIYPISKSNKNEMDKQKKKKKIRKVNIIE